MRSVSTVDRLALFLCRDDRTREMTARQLACLSVLDLLPEPRGVTRIASAIGCRPPIVTRALDALQAHDLVERRANPTDRRRVDVALTPAGRALLESLRLV